MWQIHHCLSAISQNSNIAFFGHRLSVLPLPTCYFLNSLESHRCILFFPLFNILMPSYTSRSFLSRLEEHLFKGDDILQAYLCMPLLCFWESRQNLPSHRGPLDSLNICVFQWAWPDSWLEEALLAGDTGWKYLVLKFL